LRASATRLAIPFSQFAAPHDFALYARRRWCSREPVSPSPDSREYRDWKAEAGQKV